MKDFLDARMICVSAAVTVLTAGSCTVLLAGERQSAKPGHQPRAALAQINQSAPFRLFVDGKPVVEGGPPGTLAFPKETRQTSGPSGLILLAHDNEGYKRSSITPSPQSSLATMR